MTNKFDASDVLIVLGLALLLGSAWTLAPALAGLVLGALLLAAGLARARAAQPREEG